MLPSCSERQLDQRAGPAAMPVGVDELSVGQEAEQRVAVVAGGRPRPRNIASSTAGRATRFIATNPSAQS